MGLIELFVLAVGLSMDAFAVAVCKGLSLQKINKKSMIIVGAWFGFFQGLMPLIGYLIGINFRHYIVSIDHWIAFVLLVAIGINMLKEAFSKDDEELENSKSQTEGYVILENTVMENEVIEDNVNHLGFKKMLLLAIATSIDALAMGVTFAFLNVDIIPAVCFIGIVTFILSAIGVKIGNIFGVKYKSKAEIAGGIILIFLGTKILVEHLGLLDKFM